MTKEEEAFISYWSEERGKKKQFLRKFSIGLPLGVLLVTAIMINLLSGWYSKADMELKKHSSVIIVILIAVIGIVVFMVVFSARHRWDQNEVQYQELLYKKSQEEMQQKAAN